MDSTPAKERILFQHCLITQNDFSETDQPRGLMFRVSAY